MEKLHSWSSAQFEERKIEPNSGLGQAISYLLRHWEKLTLFLRVAGAPIDNNLCTAARGSDQVMPTAGLCRLGGFPILPACFLMVPERGIIIKPLPTGKPARQGDCNDDTHIGRWGPRESAR